jgi:hypothetical protein
MNAYLAVVCRVEALDVADDVFAFLRRELLERRVVGEGEVWTFPIFQASEKFEDFTLLVAFFELAVFVADVGAVEFAGIETGLANQVPEFRRAAVNELGSEFKDFALFAERPDATADAVAGFQNENLAASLGEATGSGQASHAGTNDQNALLFGFH